MRQTLKTNILWLTVGLCFLLVSCDGKFNKAEWAKQSSDPQNYPARNNMLKDLTKNHKLIGLTYWELVGLLGYPEHSDYMDTDTYYYTIQTDYGFNIDPVYIKNLEFQLKDSVVVDYKIKEYKH